MKLSYQSSNGVYTLQCTYDERVVPKGAGFKWDPDARTWWTSSSIAAGRLARYADETAQEKLSSASGNVTESYAETSNIDVPCPDGLSFYPFQLAGIEFMNKRDASLLSDEMGMGKSIQIIGLVNLDKEITSVLIVCPAIAKYMWKAEFEKWGTRQMTVGVANGKEFPTTDIVIINYDILHKFQKELRSRAWSLRVADEVHKCKNPKTRRTQNLLGKWNGRAHRWDLPPIPGKKRIMVTGTPIVNRAIELWPIIRALDPDTWTSWHYFTQRYCRAQKTRWGLDVSGSSNLVELGQKLRSTIMVRRLKKDVLKELQDKVRQVIEVPADSVVARVINKQVVEYGLRVDKLLELENALDTAEKTHNEERHIELVGQLRDARKVAFAEMSALRVETARIKIPIVLSHIHDILENEKKVVVFCHHLCMVEALHNEFNDIAVVVTGNVSSAQRFERVKQFQEDPKILLFIGNIQAAGIAITLTASSHCVFAEISWVPGDLTQAEERLARIGQKNSVLVQHLVYEGSIDARMAKTVIAKQQNIDLIMRREGNNA
jgi:SWI/SNF-related matrix-associated actin-dependent regulator 1 of chromatin subfamily A